MVDGRIAIKEILGNVDVCEIDMSNLNIEEDGLLRYENNMLYFYGINFDNIFEILFLKDRIAFKCLTEVANAPAMHSNHTENIIIKSNHIPIQNIKGIVFNDCSLNKVFFDENSNIEYICFNQCNINSEIELRNLKNINLNIHKTILHKSVLFQNNKYNSLNIEFSTFKELVSFEDSIFEDVSFKDVVFLNYVNFKDTTFKKELDLSKISFKENVDFLNIKVYKNNINRETARVIKYYFEKQKNIIESNKFYAIEMNKKGKELFSKLIECKFSVFFEWLIFCVHKISSNHSQSWLLALIWIVIFSVLGIANEPSCSLYTFYYSDNKFDEIAKSFYNIFKFNKEEVITIYSVFIKVFMGYLIYQFIISIRQNTRRK